MSLQIVLRRSRLDDVFADATLWSDSVGVMALDRLLLAAIHHNLLTQLAATTCCRELAASRRVTGE
eukprot:scaffold117538_cov66-Cyclotella_meneghiniana.AAC.1